MQVEITTVVGRCARCGFECRATLGGHVIVAHPDRSEWAKRCWHRPATKDPLACAELARALDREAARAAT